jgi:hypothetical protein
MANYVAAAMMCSTVAASSPNNFACTAAVAAFGLFLDQNPALIRDDDCVVKFLDCPFQIPRLTRCGIYPVDGIHGFLVKFGRAVRPIAIKFADIKLIPSGLRRFSARLGDCSDKAKRN